MPALESQVLSKNGLLEADYNRPVDVDLWDAHLAGLRYHLLPRSPISGHVGLLELDPIVGQEPLDSGTPGSAGGRVHFDLLCTHCFSSIFRLGVPSVIGSARTVV